jgi:transcriptional regulator of acetoin/glycerol metabolism
VRELENVLEHAYIVTRGPNIGVDDLPNFIVEGRRRVAKTPNGVDRALRDGSWNPAAGRSDRQRLVECLEAHYWSVPRAAKALGVHRTTLWRKIKKLNISPP